MWRIRELVARRGIAVLAGLFALAFAPFRVAQSIAGASALVASRCLHKPSSVGA